MIDEKIIDHLCNLIFESQVRQFISALFEFYFKINFFIIIKHSVSKLIKIALENYVGLVNTHSDYRESKMYGVSYT